MSAQMRVVAQMCSPANLRPVAHIRPVVSHRHKGSLDALV